MNATQGTDSGPLRTLAVSLLARSSDRWRRAARVRHTAARFGRWRWRSTVHGQPHSPCSTGIRMQESAHSLAVKSYGRTVPRGGFMLMMGMPFAFVDTSDMWFGTRSSRVMVTVAGPLSTAGV